MIYFIAETKENLTKIGYTESNIESRLVQLQIGNPNKLYLVAYCDGDRQLEKKIHKELRDKRVNGEWFRVTKKSIKQYVKLYGGAFLCEESKEDKLQDKILSLEEEIGVLSAESRSLKDRLLKYRETKLDIEEAKQEFADNYVSFFESGSIANLGPKVSLTFLYIKNAYDPKKNFFHMSQEELAAKLGFSRSTVKRCLAILTEKEFVTKKKISHKIIGYALNKYKG